MEAQSIEVVVDDEAPQHGRDDKHRRVVTVDNRDNGDTIRLRVPVTATVNAVIEKIYAEFRLTRQPDDRLTCRHDGEDVYQYGELTIAGYLGERHCPNLHWSFVGDTGGASR